MIEINVDSIRRVFDENFASRGEIGASVSVWQAGREIVTLAGDSANANDRGRGPRTPPR